MEIPLIGKGQSDKQEYIDQRSNVEAAKEVEGAPRGEEGES